MSPAYHLHPEFGLLCPSQSLRRRIRSVLATLIILGLLVSAILLRPDSQGALVVARDDEALFNAETVQTATVADRSRPLENSKTACVRDAWSRIDGKCSVGTARRLPHPRAANEAPTIAALPIGRGATLTPASSVAHLSATDAKIAAPAPEVADQAGAADPAPRKMQKPSNRNSGRVLRDRRWRDDPWRAYAFSDDRYLRYRYERSWGWGPYR